jgi:ribose/xylose/arabinose/galactoside ABC-type transport system permease subunit
MLPGLANAMNFLWRVDFPYVLVAISIVLLAFLVIRRIMQHRNPALGSQKLWKFCVQLALCGGIAGFAIYSSVMMYRWQRILEVTREHVGNPRLRLAELVGAPPFVVEISNINSVPMVTGLVIVAVGLFIVYFARTKLGQDCRAVGQNQQIANVAGINVDKTRIIATIISTVLASWGMIILLHDLGHVSTYTHHNLIGFFSIAAILVGGATAARASVKNAMIGLLLFHSMFVLSPAVGRFFSEDGNVGEYLRSLMVYGVIGVSLGLYVWKNNRAAKAKERLDMREVSILDQLKAEQEEKALQKAKAQE